MTVSVHYAKTPNGYKPIILLEELGLEYQGQFVDLGKKEQKDPKFLALNPNGKIPVIIDSNPPDFESTGKPIVVIETGAILQYLARDKDPSHKFYPQTLRERKQTEEWLTFFNAGVAPILGQLAHFRSQEEKIEYAIERFTNEAKRVLKVLDERLEKNTYLAGETYTIADINAYGWLRNFFKFGFDENEFAHVARWIKLINERPAVKRAYEKY